MESESKAFGIYDQLKEAIDQQETEVALEDEAHERNGLADMAAAVEAEHAGVGVQHDLAKAAFTAAAEEQDED